MYATRMVEDTKRAERDPAFRATLSEIYAAMMNPSETSLQENQLQGLELRKAIMEGNLTLTSGVMGFSHSLGLIPIVRRGEMLQIILKIISNRSSILTLDKLAMAVTDVGGTRVMVGLALCYISYRVIMCLI